MNKVKANFVVNFGKHKNRQLSYICRYYPSYILSWWNVEANKTNSTLPKLDASVIRLAIKWLPFPSKYGHYSDGFE